MFKHAWFERNSIVMLAGVLVVISIGGIVEITPLFYLESTIEKVEGVRPYSPLELAGRNIYVREGCYNCHSQMVRPFRDEAERYGPYSLAAESMYDRPFQWGSKRTGPDLARVGNKYSDEWHREHLMAPRDLVPESVMPGYPFLARTALDLSQIKNDLRANRFAGVPYTEEMIDRAAQDARAQANPDDPNADQVVQRYAKSQVRDFDGNPAALTEMDALIAYLQMLGTLVDFSSFKSSENQR